MGFKDRILQFWNSDAGPKTIFFWAPFFKWGLVLAGVVDLFTRPAKSISILQSVALAATGIIWSRYSLVIIPKNWYLFSVNFFVAVTQIYQLGRALYYVWFVKGKEDDDTLTTITAVTNFTTNFTTIPTVSTISTTGKY